MGESTDRMPDADTIKMFMGQISKNFEEDTLKEYLSEYGQVYDTKIIRDKISGKSKGCAFVTFYTRKDALTAQMALHNLVTMPGVNHPIQMTPADSSPKSSIEDRRLFLGKISRHVLEEEIHQAFSVFGEIEDMFIMREPGEPKLCKGCAFVTFVNRDAALDAIKNLNMTQVFENHSEPTIVKFADTQKEKDRKKMITNFKPNQPPINNQGNQLASLNNYQQNAQNAAAVPLQQLLLTALAASPLIQGGGLQGALSGLTQQQLQQQQQQYYNQQQPQQQQTQQQAYMKTDQQQAQQGTNGSLTSATTPTNPLSSFSHHQSPNFNNSMAQANAMMNMLGQSYGSELLASYGLQNAFGAYNSAYNQGDGTQPYYQTSSQAKGPDGANLFIYHLPIEYRDADLNQMFRTFGNLVSATVFMDKKKNESKCFGFVSYDTATAAELAIRSMNGFQVGSKRLKVSLKTSNPKPY